MDVAINMVLPEEKKEELLIIANEKGGLSLSAFIRLVLYEYVEKWEQQKKESL